MPLKPLVKAVGLNPFETNLAATAELIKQARLKSAFIAAIIVQGCKKVRNILNL
jgi:hypothetical protein